MCGASVELSVGAQLKSSDSTQKSSEPVALVSHRATSVDCAPTSWKDDFSCIEIGNIVNLIVIVLAGSVAIFALHNLHYF